MLRNLLFVCVLCPVFVMGAAPAKGVTIDLSSPQDGGVLYPGDTAEVTITVTNDTPKRDHILVTLKVIADGAVVMDLGKTRLKLKSGEVWSQTINVTVPPDEPITEPVVATLVGVAASRRAHTEVSDSVSATVMPAP